MTVGQEEEEEEEKRGKRKEGTCQIIIPEKDRVVKSLTPIVKGHHETHLDQLE
jgi:hypothetical protein